MRAEQFLTENSDWFDKSPGGEKLYFESEVIRMMNDYANEALRIHDVSGCTCALESTDVYDDNKNYLGYVCLGCGYFSKY
jgi:hypothetical protein